MRKSCKTVGGRSLVGVATWFAVVALIVGNVHMAGAQDTQAPTALALPRVVVLTDSRIDLYVQFQDNDTAPIDMYYGVWMSTIPEVSTARVPDKLFLPPRPRLFNGQVRLEITGLQTGRLYFFRVNAIDRAGNMSLDLADNEVSGMTKYGKTLFNVTQEEADDIAGAFKRGWTRTINNGDPNAGTVRGSPNVKNVLTYRVINVKSPIAANNPGSYQIDGTLKSEWYIRGVDGPMKLNGDPIDPSRQVQTTLSYDPLSRRKLQLKIDSAGMITSPFYSAKSSARILYNKSVTKSLSAHFGLTFDIPTETIGRDISATYEAKTTETQSWISVAFTGLPYQMWGTVVLARDTMVAGNPPLLLAGFNWSSVFLMDTDVVYVEDTTTHEWWALWKFSDAVKVSPTGGTANLDFSSTQGATKTITKTAFEGPARLNANWPLTCAPAKRTDQPPCGPAPRPDMDFDGNPDGHFVAVMKVEPRLAKVGIVLSRQAVEMDFGISAQAIQTELQHSEDSTDQMSPQ